MEEKPLSTATEPNASQTSTPLALKVLLTVLSIPLAGMELFPQILPKWCSDYSYGLMLRLGITFGLVVLVWHVHSRRELLKARSAAFLAASVASALLATGLSRRAGDSDLLVITVFGAVCLAMSQKLILGCSWKQVAAAIVGAPGLFYIVTFLVDKLFHHAAGIKDFLAGYMPYYWQLGYLLGMFGAGALTNTRTPHLPDRR
jgi:hypothetical protein